MKRRKVKVMQHVDEYFERVIKQIFIKKAEIKLKYSDALKVDEARVLSEQ